MKSPWSSLAVLARLVGGAAFVVSPAGAEAPVVVSVHAPEMDWPEARRNVEAELRASGFEVEARQSAVVDPGSLLAELPLYAAQEPRSVGSVTVVRVGSTGLAYEWWNGTLRFATTPTAQVTPVLPTTYTLVVRCADPALSACRDRRDILVTPAAAVTADDVAFGRARAPSWGEPHPVIACHPSITSS